MNYKETITYLFNSAPLFQQVGKDAYKEGLDNTLTLDEHFGHPHRNFRTIHVAGTNGKAHARILWQLYCNRQAIRQGFTHHRIW